MLRGWIRFTFAALVGAASQLAGAATVVDLTAAGSTATINGAIFSIPSTVKSGTGLIDSFVRLQNNVTEQGYNTSNYSNDPELGPLDMKGGSFTHDITIGNLSTNKVTVGGIEYYEFVLDTHESNNATDRFLSLDRLEFFVGPSGTNTQTCTPPTSGPGSNTAYVPDATQPGPGTLCGLTAVYSLDVNNGTDYSIKLDSNLYSGSGQLDLIVLVPTALFGATTTDKVYLYSKFGELQPTDSTFEEWSRRNTGTYTVPIPGTVLLFGAGLLVMSTMRRRTRA